MLPNEENSLRNDSVKMVRFVRNLPIFILLILFVVDIKAQSLGWEQTQPENFDSLSSDLQVALSEYFGKEIFVDQIITAADNNDVADDHRYVIFAQIQENCEQAYYTVEAYIGFTGKLTVNYARRYE